MAQNVMNLFLYGRETREYYHDKLRILIEEFIAYHQLTCFGQNSHILPELVMK